MRVNTIENGRYYGATGAAQTGWFTVAGKWYYASSVNALLQKGLHVINGAEYYFDQNGIMQTGEFVADGKLFTTNESGAVISKSIWRTVGATIRVNGTIIRMELHIPVGLALTMFATVRWFVTVL